MDGTVPVLTDRKDIRMWKQLCTLEAAAVKGSKRNADKLRSILKSVTDASDYANPKILSKLIDVTNLYMSDELQQTLLKILEKCRITDFTPQIKAADILIAMAAFDSAKIILDRMTVISDLPRWSYLRGLVDIHEGNRDSALERFRLCYGMNDSFIPVYQELHNLEPKNGWDSRRAIAKIMAGDKGTFIDGKTGRYWELYRVYWTWKNGDGPVTDTLKRIVREGMEADIELATARISRSLGDYQEAAEHYQKAMGGLRETFFIHLEAAENQLEAGRPENALKMCETLASTGISDRRVLEISIRAMADMGNRSGMMKYLEMLLYNDYADFSAYFVCVRALIQLSMHSEASGLIGKMTAMDGSIPELHLLTSKNDFVAGRYPSALSSAAKAVRRMPNDRECLLHISKVLIAMGRQKKAQKFIDRMLSADPFDRDALLLKKDLLLSKQPPEYDAAYGVCQKIISEYPDDTATIKDSAIILGKLGRNEEALNAYRAALAVRNDSVLFLDIITSLSREKKYVDAVKLSAEYDNIYGDIIDMWIVRGNDEYILGRYIDAAGSYTRATELDHNDPMIWHSKGMAEEMAEMYDDAEISYDKAVLMDLDNSEYWISKAAVQEKKKDYVGAVDSLNRVISMHPENVYSLMRKASILVRLGKLKEAGIFVDLASKIEPLNYDIMFAKRDICYRMGDTEGTKEVCKLLLEKDPADKTTLTILAQTYLSAGVTDESLKILVDIDKQGFDYETLSLIRSIYHAQGRYTEEISTCKKILTECPDDIPTKAALAEAYLKNDMPEAAKKLYDDLHSMSPQDAEISLRKAKMSESDDAISVLMDTLESEPENRELLLEIARLHRKRGEDDEALIYIERAISVDRSVVEPHLLKMGIIAERGDYAQLQEVVNFAIASAGATEPMMWKHLGDAQMNLGEIPNALMSYDSAMKMGLVTCPILRSRGMCQEAMGMKSEAASSYEDALDIDPTDIPTIMRQTSMDLAEGKDTNALKHLDRILGIDPAYGLAIVAKIRILGAKKRKEDAKKVFEDCLAGDAEDATKREVSEIWGLINTDEDIAMPVIPLSISYVPSQAPASPVIPASQEDNEDELAAGEVQPEPEPAPAAAETAEEEAPESTLPEQPAEEIIQEETAADTAAEETPVAEEVQQEEQPAEEEASEEAPEAEEQVPEAEEQTPEERPAETPEPEPEAAAETPVAAVIPEPEPAPAESFTVESEDEDVELGFEVISSDDESPAESFTTERIVTGAPVPPVVPIPVPVPEEEPAEEEEPAAEEKKTKTVHEYALDILKCDYENSGDIDWDDMVGLVGIPDEMTEDVKNYLFDVDEYGKIDPASSEFVRMEEYSYKVVMGGEMTDVDTDPVMPLSLVHYTAGQNDLNVSKRIVAYIYEAMTCDLPPKAVSESDPAVIEEIGEDDLSVYDIMKRFKLGAYSARAVKAAVEDRRSVVGHI